MKEGTDFFKKIIFSVVATWDVRDLLGALTCVTNELFSFCTCFIELKEGEGLYLAESHENDASHEALFGSYLNPKT